MLRIRHKTTAHELTVPETALPFYPNYEPVDGTRRTTAKKRTASKRTAKKRTARKPSAKDRPSEVTPDTK